MQVSRMVEHTAIVHSSLRNNLRGAKDARVVRDAQARNRLLERPFAPTGLQRCNTNPFLGGLHTAIHRISRWDLDRFERLFMGIELDLVGSKKVLQKINAPRAILDHVPEGGATVYSTVALLHNAARCMKVATAIEWQLRG